MFHFLFAMIVSTSTFAKEATPIKVLFLGDSLTEGIGVKPEDAFPALVQKLFKEKGRNIQSINSGISGSTSASGPSRMKWALRAKPNWVIVALGANDGLRGLKVDELKRNLTETIRIAEEAKVKVALAGMKVPPNFGPQYGKQFENVFREIAKSNPKLLFIPFLLDNVAGEKNLNQADGIHPNEKGHQEMAKLVFEALEKKL
jgi:acyl-CoA thioesterase-1